MLRIWMAMGFPLAQPGRSTISCTMVLMSGLVYTPSSAQAEATFHDTAAVVNVRAPRKAPALKASVAS